MHDALREVLSQCPQAFCVVDIGRKLSIYSTHLIPNSVKPRKLRYLAFLAIVGIYETCANN